MNIKITHYPSCTWELDEDTFFCGHDEVEVVEYVEDHMGFNGPYQTESEGYACAECGESLEGSPVEDRADATAEMQLMEILQK